MVRKQVLSDSDGPVNEVSDRAKRVKSEKVSKSGLHQAATSRSRRSHTEDDDASTQEEGSPRGTKRSRLNTAGESRRTPADDDDEEIKDEDIETLPRDPKDGFIPGSIVRIKLSNFLTYDYVEFHPGSHLNMIIGPNGTGKSSIACAIALGLNFPPSVLGRANELSSFVKQDTTSGFVEIELKGPPGEENLVIQRTMTSTSKSSSFTLNGKAATGREIALKMKQLNVQVGNLCSFLPQDKVTEFAAMTPQQLLRETERAAGNRNLTMWHETLIREGKELRVITEALKSDEDDLVQQRTRNERIENQVALVKQRQQIELDISVLQAILPHVKYHVLRDQFQAAKLQQRLLHKKLLDLRAQHKPALDLKEKLKTKQDASARRRDDAKKDIGRAGHKLGKVWDENSSLEAKIEDTILKLEDLEKRQNERVENLKKKEAQLKSFQTELAQAQAVEIEDEVQVKAELATVGARRKGEQARYQQLKGQIERTIEEEIHVKNQQARVQNELKSLDNKDRQKLSNLQGWDSDVYDTLMWLRGNRDKFKMGIIEPPVICMLIKDARYARAIENSMSANQMKTFVAQCQEDYNTLNQLVQDGNAIGRKVRITAWFRDPQTAQVFDPPIPREKLSTYGLQGYLLDFIECPPGMEHYLRAEIQLHRTSISLNDNVAVREVMDAISGVIPESGNFVTGTTMHSVSRSRYGQRKVGNVTKEMRPVRNLKDHGVDAALKERYDSEINEHSVHLTAIGEELGKMKVEIQNVQVAKAPLDKLIDEANNRLKAIQTATSRIYQARSHCNRTQGEITRLKGMPGVDKERATLKKQLFDLARSRIKVTKQYLQQSRYIVDTQKLAAAIAIESVQAYSNFKALEDLCSRKNGRLEKATSAFEKAHENYEAAKVEATTALREAEAALKDLPDNVRAIFDPLIERRTEYFDALKESRENGNEPPEKDGVELRSVEELEEALTELEVQLETQNNVDAGVLDEYETRKKRIENLEASVDQQRHTLEKHQRSAKRIRDLWKPALEKLVSSIGAKFSAAFDTIGCAGEIHIRESEDGDYDKWAIDILVKFRDEEKLQLLTAQRQSGGERSLTTILYLMSLTEQARAPFSLVDEINQGMDQRAERVVHNSMVRVTCKEDSGQYFLITPKLLPDLDYNERMRVLCVFNGEWLPDQNLKGSLAGMIENFVRHKASLTSH